MEFRKLWPRKCSKASRLWFGANFPIIFHIQAMKNLHLQWSYIDFLAYHVWALFFPEKTQEILRFIVLKRESCYNPPRRLLQVPEHKIQRTSHVWGMMALSPRAPTRAQWAASSLIFVSMVSTDGCPLLKTQSFCFHSIHGTRRVMVPRPLRMGNGTDCLADCHQSSS